MRLKPLIGQFAALALFCLLAAPSASADEIALSAELRGRCLQILRQGARSDEFWPSIHAAEALTLAGHGDEVRKLLTPKLKTEQDDQHRCGLARELVRAGDRSKAAIMFDILTGADPHGHVHACESLFKVGEIGDGQSMRAAMAQDKNQTQRLMAAAALAKCGSLKALELLRADLSSDDADIARIAAWILARVGDESDIKRLRAAIKKQTDPLARAYFEHALATLGEEQGRRSLLENLSHDDPAIRTYAAVFAGDARMTEAFAPLTKLLDDDVLDIRLRAAQSLITLSQPSSTDSDEVIVRDVYPATAKNPRYSEGSIIQLSDGALLYATTEFADSSSDFAKARIIARRSNDGGRHWSEPRVLQENIGQRNVMSVTLRRLTEPKPNGAPLGMFYLVKDDFDNLRVYLRISHDEASTFGEPILVTNQPGYHVMNNDRVTRLSSGRLLVPVASTEDVKKVNHFVSRCYLSDNGGQTWRSGIGQVDFTKRGAMEPEVVELDRGRLAMIVRTQSGFIAVSHSTDGGETWTEAKSWKVKAPEAPSTLRRIPATGDLLLIWNHTYTAGVGHGGKRTPLTAAVSSDEGRTWKYIQNLETQADNSYAYTSVAFDSGRVLMSYYVGQKNGRISSRFRSMPVTALYRSQP